MIQLVASLRRDLMGPGSNPGKTQQFFRLTFFILFIGIYGIPDTVCTRVVEGGIPCKNAKRGDLNRCGNYMYRGITLVSIPREIINIIILNIIRDNTDLPLRDMQAGLRKRKTMYGTDCHTPNNPGVVCRMKGQSTSISCTCISKMLLTAWTETLFGSF